MSSFDPQKYGPVIAELLVIPRLCELGPGRPETAARPQLAALDLDLAWPEDQIVDADMAQCCLAGLWLRFDFLDESHRISQAIASSTGSYWHGIMHRREPDFSNSKYWFRRVGRHEVFTSLGAEARALAQRESGEQAGRRLAGQGSWDPLEFVDLCEQCLRGRGSPADEQLCRQVAQLEWELLFDYCYENARRA